MFYFQEKRVSTNHEMYTLINKNNGKILELNIM